MEKNNERHTLVLAVSPTVRGFGFAVFEGPTTLIDWGVRETRRDKAAACRVKLDELIDFYRPDILVIEDDTDEKTRRGKRIRGLVGTIARLASERRIICQKISRTEVRETFAQFGAETKYQIAKTITEWLPDLAPRMPRYRKPWMSEDYRMGIFDAVALVLAYYYIEAY